MLRAGKWSFWLAFALGVCGPLALYLLWNAAVGDDWRMVAIRNSEPFPIRIEFDQGPNPWTIPAGATQEYGVLPVDGMVTIKAFNAGRPSSFPAFFARFLASEIGPPGHEVTAVVNVPTGKLVTVLVSR